jgi:hypothetical protein
MFLAARTIRSLDLQNSFSEQVDDLDDMLFSPEAACSTSRRTSG